MKYKNKILDNKYEYTLLIAFTLAYVVFCNYLMEEVPHLSWFDQFWIIEKLSNNNLNFKDMINVYGEHGMLGTNILFVINVLLFKLTTFFDVYINDINVFLCGCLAMYSIRKFSNLTSKFFLRIIQLSCCIITFNFYQLSSGGMETQVRLGLLFFILSAFMIDNVFHNRVSYSYFIFTVICIFLSICVFGTFYSFAGTPFMIGLFLYVVHNRQKNIRERDMIQEKRKNYIFISYFSSIVIYFIEYGNKILNQSSEEAKEIFIVLSKPIEAMKAVFGYGASSLLGFRAIESNFLPTFAYLLIGFIITVIIFLVLLIHYRNSMQKTFFPIMMITYSYFVLALIYAGRYPIVNTWKLVSNYWYLVHTKPLIIGILLIIAMNYRKNNRILLWLFLLFITMMAMIGNFIELKVAPYENEYYKTMQTYLFQNSNEKIIVDENGNTKLLHSYEMTKKAIKLLKNNKLSVYKDIGQKFEKAKIIYGIEPDHWVRDKFLIFIKSGEKGNIKLKGFFPGAINGNQNISFKINDGYKSKTIDYVIKDKVFELNFAVEPETIVEIVGQENFFYNEKSLEDRRPLCFILSDISGR